MKYYDNTRIGDYKTCPRKYLLRHEFDLVHEGNPLALTNGLCWHDAMDVVWTMVNARQPNDQVLGAAMKRWVETWKEWGMDFPLTLEQQEKCAPRTPMIAAEMLTNYISQRGDFIRECELVAVEQPFAVKLYSDDTPIRYIGRFDKVVIHPNHGRLLIEHKTSSLYSKASGLRPDYIKSWSPNSQIDGYLHAANMIYENGVNGIWIDAALVHKTVHNVFKFIPIDRQFAQLDQWLYETRDWIQRIEDEKARFGAGPGESDQNYGGFPKNTGSCSMWAGCSYRDLCKFNPVPSNILSNHDGFKIEHWEPFDILKIEELGLMPEKSNIAGIAIHSNSDETAILKKLDKIAPDGEI